MTERKTGPLSIFRRPDTGNLSAGASAKADVPAPWVPTDLPASNAAPGRAVAKRNRATSPPAPWVPPELPASTDAPVKRDRAIAKSKPWVPPAEAPPSEAPRNLPAAAAGNGGVTKTPEQIIEVVPGQTIPAQNTGGPTTIIVNNQVAAPAPVVYAPWWGWWGGCPRGYCPRHAGRMCWHIFCSWW